MILKYAPMSNGRYRRMFGTIKKSLAEIMFQEQQVLSTAIITEVYGYKRIAESAHPISVQLVHGVVSKMTCEKPFYISEICTAIMTRLFRLAVNAPFKARKKRFKTTDWKKRGAAGAEDWCHWCSTSWRGRLLSAEWGQIPFHPNNISFDGLLQRLIIAMKSSRTIQKFL